MRVIFARLKSLGPCVALAVTLLFTACTTTTTLTTSEDSPPASAARRDETSHAPSRGYIVQRGDTLYSIAFRNRVDLRELIAWNQLSEPYTIYPGQRLRIAFKPARDNIPIADGERETTIASRSMPASRTELPPEPTRVARGRAVEPESRIDAAPRAAYKGAADAAADPATAQADADAARRVAEMPPASNPGKPISEPQAAPPVASMPAIPIAVDEGVRAAVVDDTQPNRANSDSTGSAPPLSVAARTVPVSPALPQTPAEPLRDAGPIRPAPTRMVGGIGWRWPNSATLVGRYSAADEARQGIRLQAPAGTPVNATADGEVVYSGNGLVGLGELVIIKHGPDYLSAYGLNRKRLVTEGQKVKAGETVAEMGNSAGVAGLLHFEVRRSGRPIDPLTVLPQR